MKIVVLMHFMPHFLEVIKIEDFDADAIVRENVFNVVQDTVVQAM